MKPMAVDVLLAELGYDDSPNFLRADQTHNFSQTIDYGQILRRATEHCQLKGVYALRQSRKDIHETVVPLVYICQAKNDDDAERIHRLVWNQNTVPFLIIVSQKAIRLYSGFRYGRATDGSKSPTQGLLMAADTVDQAMTFLGSFCSEKIDDGTVWEEWGKELTPETRVDWSLLAKLNELDKWLQGNGLTSEVSHSVIGKYLYLYYLRHRDILSDRKLAKWGLEEGAIFGRDASLEAFWSVVGKLDEWLNGSAFVLEHSRHAGLTASQLQKVAGTFRGDDPASGQLVFDFGIYDFSFIPIETISVIYEQFLHAPNTEGTSTGKESGAFYTPIPLVNFMLEELDSLHPFKKGMKVLDPSCGSGAFLVQCYRRIIEQDKEFVPGRPMRPAHLRDLLKSHIFGIDRDGDACRVAELSLSLTLLDYVDPPDLESTPKFQLPDLHGTNIFEGDFFDQDATWRQAFSELEFDWIVGNPPWIELKSGKIADRDTLVWRWMQDAENRATFPTGGNQVAEAFAWEVTKLLASDGYAGLLLPAMTLFKYESAAFRKAFFNQLAVKSVANFANLRHVLFPGHKRRVNGKTISVRPKRPAAGFFYTHNTASEQDATIWAFSPLVADQPSNRPAGQRPRQRQNVWNIVVAANQVQPVNAEDATSGSPLPWKLAMWGSHLDSRLIAIVNRKYDTLKTFCSRNGLSIGEGFQLRTARSEEATDAVPELEDKFEIDTNALRSLGLIFEFPKDALKKISKDRCFVRKNRWELPLAVSRPPHIIVDKLRRFAVYTDQFLLVPPRQIGIAGNELQRDLLKALSLYLVSDFAMYHQFLHSPEWGVSTPISTLKTLRQLPVPLGKLSSEQLAVWAELYTAIVRASRQEPDPETGWHLQNEGHLGELLSKMNDRVYDVLGIRPDQKALVSDLVNLRMKINEGQTPKEAIRPPSEPELKEYARQLRDDLDAFTDDQPSIRHRVVVGKDGHQGIVSIALNQGASGVIAVEIVDMKKARQSLFSEAQQAMKQRHSQWVYFERNVRLYEGTTTYLFKPLEKLHWTVTKAQLDAGTIISETLTG
jgi:hypothetical protein